MKMLLNGIKTVLDFDKFPIYTVAIENKKFYFDAVNEFISSLDGDSDKDVLYTDEKTLVFSKNAILVGNIFDLDFGSTKLTNALYDSLCKKVQTAELQGEYLELVKVLTSFYEKLQNESDFAVDWKNDVSLLPLLKVAGYSFNVYGERGSLEQILDYLHICRDALGVKIFVFMNAKMLFEETELKLFYEQCAKEAIKILNLDAIATSSVCAEEKIVIVDKELCEIF